jgi:hypothetical protein
MNIVAPPRADFVKCCIQIIKDIVDQFNLFLMEEKSASSSSICFLYGIDQLFSLSVFILIEDVTKGYG